jgi:outer membrane protein TolC
MIDSHAIFCLIEFKNFKNSYLESAMYCKKAAATWVHPLRLSLVAVACLLASGCASVQPVALSQQDMQAQLQQDSDTMRKDVEPISGPLSLDDAMARALKYNLDRRSKMMEEALAMGQLDVSKFDMLPKIMAQAGYAYRDRTRFTYSSSYPDDQPTSTTPATTSERNHTTRDLGLTWSMLDVGLGYHGSKQQADRLMIAGEKRRKAMHVLMQDVRTAYWRAASAQLLKADVQKTIALAEEALVDARKVAGERVKNPLEPLRYQRQLLENLRLLENINQELSSAQVDLAGLINAPLNQALEIAPTELKNISEEVSQVPVDKLEEVALHNNADLREQHYNARIAREETRRTMLRMFPNLTFSYGTKYDTDRYLLSNNWNEAGLQLSFNLMNLVTGSTQLKLAEAGVALADQRRVAAQAAVLTQVHIARLQVINARSQFDRADAIYATDSKIAEVMRNRQMVAAQSKLDVVSTETASILSLLRRYQALAQVQVSENRLVATLGMEPQIGSTSELSLKDLSAQIGASKAQWQQLSQGTKATNDRGEAKQ